MLLDIKNLKKVYGKGDSKVEALKDVNFSAREGEFISIMGESGSGKSTLLNLIATFDQADAGSILIKDQNVSELKSSEIALFRRQVLGFVFQDFNLLHTMSNKDNILMPLVLSGYKAENMQTRLEKVANQIGISAHLDKFPYQISGGQQQRVAIARALISEPSILLADEPTGALDSKTSENIMSLFQEINTTGQTVLMVTHSIRDAAYSSRVLFIKDGILYHEIYRGDTSITDFQKRISDSLAMLNERGD